MVSACVLLLVVVAVTAERCRRPSCAELLTQLPGMVRWCSIRMLDGKKTIVDTILACDHLEGFHETPRRVLDVNVLIGVSDNYKNIVRSDSTWLVCRAARDNIDDQDDSEAFFGAVWDVSEGFCPETYSVWLATFKTPHCWDYNNANVYESEVKIDQDQAASLPEAQSYRCKDCTFSEGSAEDRNFFGRQHYTYIIAKDKTATLFRYLSCNDNNTQNFPVLKVVKTKEYACDRCRRWVDISLNGVTECETATKHQDGTRDICKPKTIPPTAEETPVSLSTQQMAKESPDLTATQLPPASESKDTETNENENRVREALDQLTSQTFDDNALKDPAKMLMYMGTIISFSNNLTQENVSLALEGLERFSKQKLLDIINKGERKVNTTYNDLTLVVAAGVSGVLVSDTGEKIELLPEGEEQLEAVLAGPATVGALLSVGRGETAAGVAVTVFPRRSLNATFSEQNIIVNSDVISVQVVAPNSSLDYVDVVLTPRFRGVRRRCGMWDLAANRWDYTSCELLRRGQVTEVCRCKHLTHFAQLVTDADVEWGEEHARSLEVLSLAGVAASLLGALGLAVTAAFAHSWRRKAGTRVLLQLGSAVAARDVLMALVTVNGLLPAGLWPVADPSSCRALGVGLHYALLAAATWTTAAAVLQLLRLATISGAQAVFPHVVLVCSACSWLLPLVPVVTLLSTLGLEAGYPQRGGSATDFLCYPQGVALYTAVVLPVALCTTINAAIFLFLLLTVLFPVSRGGAGPKIRRHGSVNLRRRALTAVVLFFLLGLPWLLGPPARIPLLAYLFCAVATPQGMTLFVFFVLCNGQLRSSLRAAVSRVVSTGTATSGVSGVSFKRSRATSNTHRSDSVSDKVGLLRRRLSSQLQDLKGSLKKRPDKPVENLETSS